MVDKLKHQALTQSIIGAAMDVMNELKPGLDEKLYERALCIELLARGHKVDQQARHEVNYKGHLIGTLIPDLVIDDAVIVDLKIAEDFHDSHVAQMLGYLAHTCLEVGLLINFKHATVSWKRIVR